MQNRKAGAAGIVCSVAAIIAIVLGNGHVRTNERGLELIGNAESCRRDPYVCPAGVLTDGMETPTALNPAQLKTTSRSRLNGKKISSMLNPALTGTPTAKILATIPFLP